MTFPSHDSLLLGVFCVMPFPGKLVLPMKSSVGCTVASYGAVPEQPWIALVERGVCPFKDKDAVAQELGAVGLIVYQHDKSSLTVMKSLSSE